MGWAEARSDACPQGRSGRAGDRRLPPLRTAEAVSGGLCLPLSQEVSDKRGITKQKHKRGITKQKPRTSQEGLEDCRGVLPPLARPPGPRRGAAAAGRPERACCLLLLAAAGEARASRWAGGGGDVRGRCPATKKSWPGAVAIFTTQDTVWVDMGQPRREKRGTLGVQRHTDAGRGEA